MMFWPLFFLIALLGLAAVRADLRTASLVIVASVLFYGFFGDSWTMFALLTIVCCVVLLPLNIAALRQEWLSRPLFAGFRRLVQTLDPDTLAALDAGTVGWDAGLLGGELDWARIEALPAALPTPQERALIERLLGDYRRFCASTRDWPGRRLWLCERGLFGLGISQAYGGLGLSVIGQSLALSQLAAYDPQAAEEIGSPARLAWIDLLLRHGTPAQCEHLLPVLASGEHSIGRPRDLCIGTAIAVAMRREDGSGVGLALTIDGAPPEPSNCTLVGFLVQVDDPDKLLDPAARKGPTCILLPRTMDGLGGNLRLVGSLTIGTDDSVVGGPQRIGRGAIDLEESQAVAGATALPAIHAGVATTAAIAAGGFARCHAPFTPAVGTYAVAQEALAAIGAAAYASRAVAAGAALAAGGDAKPLAPAAFSRTFAVDQRRSIEEACNDLGLGSHTLHSLTAFATIDSGRSLPPRLARPVDYTACILSGHSAFSSALGAAREKNPARALENFDAAFWGHCGHVLSSGTRAFMLALSGGLFSNVRAKSPATHRLAQRVNRYSAALAFAADIALSRLGWDLSSRRSFTALRSAHEAARLTLTTWLGDVLAQLWMTLCVLKYFEDAGSPVAERAIVEWVCSRALGAVEESLDQVLRHLSSPTLALFTRLLMFPLGRAAPAPSDAANRLVAQRLMDETQLRDGMAPEDARLTALDRAVVATLEGEALEQQITGPSGSPAGNRAGIPAFARVERAFADGLVDATQVQQLRYWLAAIRALDEPPPTAASHNDIEP